MSQVDIDKRTLGVTFTTGQEANVLLWAPGAKQVAMTINGDSASLSLKNEETGYWHLNTQQLKPGDYYMFVIDEEKESADPASLSQPQGLYGASQAVDTNVFYWEDDGWVNPPLDDYIAYELDVHTFTPEGTFDALVHKLPYVKSLGVNALVIRPVVPFPDAEHWQPDGIFLYAVQVAYGGPGHLQKLVNACHYEGIAVVLDLVYSQQGISARHDKSHHILKRKTSRPESVHASEAQLEAGRRYLIENALMWFRDFHVDALRLKADYTLPNLERVLADIRAYTNKLTARTGRHHYLLVEHDLATVPSAPTGNEASQPKPHQQTDSEGEKYQSYCVDYDAHKHLAKTYRDEYLYDEPFSVALNELFGQKADASPQEPFVMFSQHPDHRYAQSGKTTDQVANLELLKLMAGSMMVSPYVPMLFMGEEWGVANPFDESAKANQRSTTSVSDLAGNKPGSSSVFPANTVEPRPDKTLFHFYQALTALRRQQPALCHLNRKQVEVFHQKERKAMILHRWYNQNHVLCLMNFSPVKQTVNLPSLGYRWQKVLDSADPKWQGPSASPDVLADADGLTLQADSLVVYKVQF